MKKSIASALTAAIVLSAASTTFATPTDEEVAALRARVAELERLTREQNVRRDVNNLDYRVTELERTSGDSLADRFKIGGEMRYRFWGLHKAEDKSRLELRLLPTFKIDEHLAIKSRITGSYEDFHKDPGCAFVMNWAYLEGKYDNFQVNAGKIPLVSQADSTPNSGSLVFDDDFSGIQLMTGDQNKFLVNLGSFDNYVYAGAEALLNPSEDLNWGVGYHYSKQQDVATAKKVSIITAGAGYKLNEDWGIYGAIAHNTESKKDKTAYNIEGTYKGADRNEKASWGAYAAYRYAPVGTARIPTYDTFAKGNKNKKGFEIGATWTPYPNTITKLAYFHGKTFNKVNDRTIFARASIFF